MSFCRETLNGVKKIAAYFEHPVLIADSREFVTYTGTLEGETVSVTSTGIGGPSAAIAMEELFKAGAHTFIRVGTCGGIDTEVQSGDLVIATGAVRAEGTSREYARSNIRQSQTWMWSAHCERQPGIRQSDSIRALCRARTPFTDSTSRRSCRWITCCCSTGAWKKDGMPCIGNGIRGAVYRGAVSSGARCGCVFLTMANQEREVLGLSNPVVHDTDMAVRVGGGTEKLIAQDRMTKL